MLDDTKLALFSPNALAYLSPIYGYLEGVSSAVVTEARNGAYELEVVCWPMAVTSGLNAPLPQPNMIIVAKPNPIDDPQPFRIYSSRMDINGRLVIRARHISYDLSWIVYTGSPPGSYTVSGIMGTLTNLTGFNFSTDATGNVRWGFDVPVTVRSLMGGVEGSLLDVIGGEWRFDGKQCQLLTDRASHVYHVRYGANMTALDRLLTNEESYNSGFGFWQREGEATVSSGRVDISSGILDVDGRQGEAAWTTQRAKIYDLSDQYDSAPTQATLQAKVRSLLEADNAATVKSSITVSAVDNPGIFGQDWSELQLCDYAVIHHPQIGEATAKITRTKYDVLRRRYTEVTIGAPRKTLPKRLAELERRASL